MGKKLGNAAYRILLTVMLILCVFIGTGAVRYAQSEVFGNVLSPSVNLLFLLLLASMICVFIVLLYRALDRLSRGQLIGTSVILLAVMSLIFLIVLCNFELTPSSDSLHIQDTALYFARTGEVPLSDTAFNSGYFSRYANNYFLVVVLRYYFKLCLLMGIQDMYWPLIILSFTAIMTAVVFMYLTGVLLGGIRKGTKILALCVMNPLYYLIVLWVYTNSMSIPFMVAGIYFSLCVYKAGSACRRRVFCVLTAIVAAVGYYVRPVSVFPIIAAAICAFLWGLRSRKNMIRVLKCAVICAVVALILVKGISMLNDMHFSTVSEGNFPPTHWIMMASHKSGYYVKEDVSFTAKFDSYEEKLKATTQKLIENYRKKTLTGLFSFLCDKMLIVWSKGDEWVSVSQDKKMTPMYSYLVGSQSDLFQAYCYAFRIVTVFLILISIWKLLGKKEIDPAQFIFILALFGGILFYWFWEIKPKYSMPFVYVMLLIAENGAETLAQSSRSMREGLRRRGKTVAAASLVCALGICVLTYNDIVNSDVVHKDWSWRGQKQSTMQNILPNEKKVELTQEIYISKPFNRIVVAGNADKKAVEAGETARFTLLNGDGQVVYEQVIQAQEFAKKGYPVIKTGRIVPNGREKFTVCLSKDSQSDGKFYFRCKDNQYIDLYEGVLTVNGGQQRNDLFLQVYNEYNGPWCSVKIARILFVALVFAVLLLHFWMYMDIKKSGAANKQSA